MVVIITVENHMALSIKQQGVLKGMIIGLIISIIVIVSGLYYHLVGLADLTRMGCLSVAAKSTLLPSVFLIFAIARLARQRFFCETDIDGSGLSQGTEQAKVLQSLIQNTLEQMALIVPVYFAWAMVMPIHTMIILPMVSILFALGRTLFFIGYQRGAASRALGFTLTFYPTVILFIIVVVTVLT